MADEVVVALIGASATVVSALVVTAGALLGNGRARSHGDAREPRERERDKT